MTITAHDHWWDAVFVTVLMSLDADVDSVYLSFLCSSVKVTVSVSCLSVLLLNDKYFYLLKMKYESMMILMHTDTILDCHLIQSAVLWFVTLHPSPPTSLRFWSTLGWVVIMLMQLCSIKVSAPTPLFQSPPQSPITFLFACILPPASVGFNYCVILTVYCIYFNIVCSDIHYHHLPHQLKTMH